MVVMIDIIKIIWCFTDKLDNYPLLPNRKGPSYLVFHVSCDSNGWRSSTEKYLRRNILKPKENWREAIGTVVKLFIIENKLYVPSIFSIFKVCIYVDI